MSAKEELVVIGAAARQFGLATSTLRYWEERGLIAPSIRQSGRRYYDHETLLRIGLIQMWQRDALMSLDEIALVLQGGSDSWRVTVRSRIAAITDQMQRLAEGRTQLEHLLTCPRKKPVNCPYLRQSVDAPPSS